MAKFKATGLIQRKIDEKDIKYKVDISDSGSEMITAGYTISGGPFIQIRFISRDDDNDVSIRVLKLSMTFRQKSAQRSWKYAIRCIIKFVT